MSLNTGNFNGTIWYRTSVFHTKMITLAACIQSMGLLIIFEGCTDRKYAEIYENKRRYISYDKTNSTEWGMGVSVWFGSQIGQAKTTSKWQKTTTNVKYILWVDRASNRMFIWPNFRLPMFSIVFSCKMRNTPRRQDDWGRVDGLRSFKYEATFWSV